MMSKVCNREQRDIFPPGLWSRSNRLVDRYAAQKSGELHALNRLGSVSELLFSVSVAS